MELDKLFQIQQKLSVPKKQWNSYGNYNYRSQEDILEAVKPLCEELKCLVKLSDELVNIGNSNYIKSTAMLVDITGEVISEATGYAREALTQKGMNDAQITGSTSSYARKYALNGLFGIDDIKDDDHNNKHGKDGKPNAVNPKQDDLKYQKRFEQIGETIKKITSTTPESTVAKIHGNIEEELPEEMKNTRLEELKKHLESLGYNYLIDPLS